MRMRTKIGRFLAQGVLLTSLFVPLFALAQSTTPSAPSANSATGGSFVALTQFPQIQALANSSSFATFVNTLYKICLGAGAVLAVIMIMVAGVQFMTSQGSVASNEKAKSRIQNAILGLILVLAPTIVFGIINPSILNLNLGSEFGGLKGAGINQGAFATPTTANSGSSAGTTCPANLTAVNQGTSCPAGLQPTTQSCCQNIGPLGVCCAPPANTQSYILSYYFTKTITSTNYTCYVTSSQSFPSQSACTTAENEVPATIGQPSAGMSVSSVTYVNSCTQGSASPATPPGNIPLCSN